MAPPFLKLSGVFMPEIKEEIFTVPLPTKDTELPVIGFQLPERTVSYAFKIRGAGVVRFSNIQGQVQPASEPFGTIEPKDSVGNVFVEGFFYDPDQKWFFAGSVDNMVVEIYAQTV